MYNSKKKIEFEWDDKKAEKNRTKHGVTFEQAQSVFDDPYAVPFEDTEHSIAEQRFAMIGMATNGLLVVSFTYRHDVYVLSQPGEQVPTCGGFMPEKVDKLPVDQNQLQPEIDEAESLDELDEKLKRMKRLPRGTFLAEPGATTDPRKTKIRVTLYLDKDVLDYFKERAAQPNAAPYQTQINYELCAIMEQALAEQQSVSTLDYTQLLQNKKFIAAVAEKVQEYTVNREE